MSRPNKDEMKGGFAPLRGAGVESDFLNYRNHRTNESLATLDFTVRPDGSTVLPG